MTERKPDQNVVDELKEFGRQLTVTMKAVAGSDQLRTLGHELKDGLREAAQRVDEAWDAIRERDEVQRLQERAADVAESFKTGEAQHELRAEIAAALHALNVRLSQVLQRTQPVTAPPVDQATPQPDEPLAVSDAAYTGATRNLES